MDAGCPQHLLALLTQSSRTKNIRNYPTDPTLSYQSHTEGRSQLWQQWSSLLSSFRSFQELLEALSGYEGQWVLLLSKALKQEQVPILMMHGIGISYGC